MLGTQMVLVHTACAGDDTVPTGRVIRDPQSRISIFKNYSVRNFFGPVVDVNDSDEKAAAEKVEVAKADAAKTDPAKLDATKPGAPEAAPSESSKGAADPAQAKAGAANQPQQAQAPESRASLARPGPVFVDKFKPGDLLPPDQDPRVRLNPEAPAPFIGMALAHQEGDKELAEKYADTWVRYQQNIFFEVRELTTLIGQALIRQKAIEAEDWDGVEQYIGREMAVVREERGEVFRPTHGKAMERIKPDPGGKADIYYFFTLNCTHCRAMASDVERLWRSVKDDPNVRMVGVTLGTYPELWVQQYREYTGVTFPILNGEELAKAFDLKFVPAIVIYAPGGKAAYRKSGQQSFANMYDFVRHVQGLPSTVTPMIERLVTTPIGQVERDLVERGEWKKSEIMTSDGLKLKTVRVELPKAGKAVTIERF